MHGVRLSSSVTLPQLSSSGVIVVNFLYSHHLQVLDAVVRLIEVGCHWFVQFLGLDIQAVAIETDMQSIDRLADILHSTFSALNHIYNVAGLASETCSMFFLCNDF